MDLEGIYHKGQLRGWNGRTVLSSLIEKHQGGKAVTSLSECERASLIRVLSVILRGENVAWKISSLLSTDLDDVGPRMAATSQAHDEARHFFVMRDYFRLVLDHEPRDEDLSEEAKKGLEMVEAASTLSAKLLGMQLLVEPVAITLFRALRKIDIEPVLTDLMPFFERDEARHIALGVNHLPAILRKMSWVQIGVLLAWQIRVLRAEIRGLKSLEADLIVLGIDPVSALNVAEKRQIDAVSEMTKNLGWHLPIVPIMRRAFTFEKSLVFSSKDTRRLTKYVNAVWSAARGS